MAGDSFISFEDWVEWMFDRRGTDWVWEEEFEWQPWLQNRRLVAEHAIRLHNNPVPVLSRFSNEQAGDGLWILYSSATEYCMFSESCKLPTELYHLLIMSLVPLLRQLLPERLPLSDESESDRIACAVYMFWDIAPIWPDRSTDSDKAELDVCLDEMRQALMIPHPAAHKHALHGLGHFCLYARERTTPIIDDWLKTNPRILPSIREYALLARVGGVQ